MASDPELVAFIRGGDREAFEAVYERYQREILAYCRRLLGDRHEAEDALQHTFLAAYTNIMASEQELELRPWLYAIARNRCYSLLRARREVAVPELEHGLGEEPGVLVARREDLRDLVLDVNRLPDDQRAALVMAELGAHSHDEIAGVLEVPRAKVKSLVFQARESLVASRSAREIDCAEIRRQLHMVRGAALRRGALRRHLRDCPDCREYRRRMRPPVARVAGFVPIGPWLALRAVLSRSSGPERVVSTASGAGAPAAAAVKLGALKPLAGALAAMLSAASAVVAVHSIARHHPHRRPAAVVAVHRPAAPASPAVRADRANSGAVRVDTPVRTARAAVSRAPRPAVTVRPAPVRHRSLGAARVVRRRQRYSSSARHSTHHTAQVIAPPAANPSPPAANPSPPATPLPPVLTPPTPPVLVTHPPLDLPETPPVNLPTPGHGRVLPGTPTPTEDPGSGDPGGHIAAVSPVPLPRLPKLPLVKLPQTSDSTGPAKTTSTAPGKSASAPGHKLLP